MILFSIINVQINQAQTDKGIAYENYNCNGFL